SLLPDILQRVTKLPVREIHDGMPIEAGKVFVAPTGELSVSDGIFKLVTRDDHPSRLPIDHFFQSLAEERGSMAIGVLLSGSASDGTMGLKAIKAASGLTVVQDPATAEYNSMPAIAIRSGVVDWVLEAANIIPQIEGFCSNYRGSVDLQVDS